MPSFADTATTSEQSTLPQTTTEASRAAQPEENPAPEEKPTVSVEPPSTADSSPTAKSRKKDRRKRKRPPKINLKEEIIRAAGDESYDSSELSEIEFYKSREEDDRKDKPPKEQEVAADKAAFPVGIPCPLPLKKIP